MTQPQNPVIANTNSVIVLGAVARDIEIQELQSGSKRIRLTVAGEELVTNDQGKVIRSPFYEQAVLFGKRADRVLEMGLKVGDAVLMDGKFKMRVYEDKDGVERKDLEIDYGAIRRAMGFEKAERTKDAGGNVRLVGGFTKATVYGRVIGQGGDLRYTKQGTAILNFSVNARSSWKDASGNWENDAAFVRTSVWGPLGAELAELGIAKGMEAMVSGRVQRGSYDGKDGRKVYTTEINANHVVIAEGQEGGGGGTYTGGASFDNLPGFGSFGGGLDIDQGSASEEQEMPF